MRGVVCSGNIVLDQLVHPVDEIVWGASCWVHLNRSLGGNGASTSYTLGKLGVRVRLLGVAGGDEPGNYALAGLSDAGVDTALVTRSSLPTSASIVLVRSDGARCFLHQPGASLEAFPEPLDFSSSVTEGASYYHLGSPFALPAQRPYLAETLRRARAAGLATSLDAQWDSRGEWMKTLAPALPFVDVLFLNQDEARMLVGTEDPRAAASALRAAGAGTVVVKLGPCGCAVVGDGIDFHEPAYDVPVVDTTGAGDCFNGGFLCALARGGGLREAARLANAAGALSIRKPGAVAGLGSYEETLAAMSSLPLRDPSGN